MEKNEVWENIKKYAKVFFQGVGLFFAYVFHYIAVFAKFVYKHLKKLFKKLYRIIRRHIRRVCCSKVYPSGIGFVSLTSIR